MSWIVDKWRKRKDRQPNIALPGGESATKAGPTGFQSMQVDPWELALNQEFIESMNQHSAQSNLTLQMLAQTPFTAMFVRYFPNQLAKFARPQQGRFGLGFRIVMREEKKAPSSTAQKEIERLTRMALTCGEYANEDVERYTRDSFDTFLRKVIRDSTIYDAMTFEIMRDRKGKPAAWEAVDASTIYRVKPKTPYALMDPDDAAYVQRVNMQNARWFGAADLAYAVRCPSTDLKSAGYGRPELVELLAILNQILSAYQMNTNLLKQGGPRGLLAVMGDPIPEDKFQGFVRGIRVMFSGVRNAYRTPVINMTGPNSDAKWVQTDMANLHDMQFAEMIRINFQILCSLFGVAPEEVGFYFGNAGQSSSLNQGGIADKVQTGVARGITPFAYTAEAALNRWIWHPMTDDFEIRFCGLEGRTEKEQAELDEIRLRTYCTVNEVRAEHNLEDRDDCDVIESPVWLQAKEAQDANAAGSGDGGGPDGGGDGEPEPGDWKEAEGKTAPGSSKKPVKDPTTDWGDNEPSEVAEGQEEAKKSLGSCRTFVIEI